jgi:hypothetical protein
MARKHFQQYEAISSAMPAGNDYEAVIGVKRRGDDTRPRFHVVGYGQRFHRLTEAEEVAEAALTKVVEVDEDGGLIMES